MGRESSLQQRIAVRIIACTALLNVLLCTIILVLFWFYASSFSVGQVVTMADVRRIFSMLLLFCCIGTGFNIVLLYFIARHLAKESIRPITDIINTANAITQHTLDARIPKPAHRDELYELTDTINRLLDRVGTAMEREKSLTSYASHEFRTPLAVLKGKMEVLIRKPRRVDEYTRRIQECVAEVDRMNTMVEQLLVYARYESGRQQLKYVPLQLRDLVNAVVSLHSDAMLARSLKLVVDVEPARLSLVTDESVLTTILTNLLSNAVKYSNDGGTIRVKAAAVGDDISIELSNTGRGLSEDEVAHVFDRFYRSHQSHSSGVKGFGLGLPIVKQCCDLLDMDVQLTSSREGLITVSLLVAREPWKQS